MSSLSNDSLLLEFVTESKEHLSSIEPDLLILEREGSNAEAEIINRVFRAIHSIKGAAGFFGLVALKELSHTMESVLMLVRDGKLTAGPDIMDPLLAGVDKLNLMLDDIHTSESVPFKEEMQQLETLLGKPPGDATTASDTAATPTENKPASSTGGLKMDPIAIESAAKQGQKLFTITISIDQDLAAKNRTPLELLEQILSVGLILDSTFDLNGFPDLTGCLDASLKLLVLCATVLEKELLAMAIDIPDEQVEAVTQDKPQAAVPDTAPAAQAVSAAVTPTPNGQHPKDQPVPSVAEAGKPKQGAPAGEAAGETIRVRVDLLNKLMDLAGEMVLSRNQLLRSLSHQTHQSTALMNISQNIDLITSDLQEHIMQTRMQPVGSVFGKFPRVVRDMAKQLGKEIDLKTIGEEVELDKTILESLSDPLTHLIRNCCDHAIEMPEERTQNGKPSAGTITLKAYHEGGQINIAIIDDGRGIDHTRLVKKALSHGLLSEAEVKKMTPQELVNLIFMPGLSTAEAVSDISGRGVGMDVVKTNIEKVGGHISIETQLGQGTTILLRLPLTLAIIPSLVVGTCDQRFAVPQVNLVELVCIKAAEIATRVEKVGTAAVLRLRGKLLPLVRLSDVLGLQRHFLHNETGEYRVDRRTEIADPRSLDLPQEDETDKKRNHWSSDYNILVLKVGINHFGLIVDKLFDMEEIVVKPLSSYLKNCKCFAGATIMGDGRVAMILDAGGILSSAKLSYAELKIEEERQKQRRLFLNSDAGIERQAIILFANAPDEVFAMPLAKVLRLEKFSPDNIEHVGGREFLTYRDKSIELVRLENHLPVQPCTTERKDMFLLLPKSGNGQIGIIASQILDTMEAEINIDQSMIKETGIMGSAVLNGHLTVFIEPDEFLNKVGMRRGMAYVQ